MSDTATFRGSGGTEWTFDLPTSEVFRNQIAKGDLKPVDESAHEYAASLVETGRMRQPDHDEDVEPDTAEDVEPEPASAAEPPMAGPGSSRKAWAAWAESQGVQVEDDDTRDDIIAKLNG